MTTEIATLINSVAGAAGANASTDKILGVQGGVVKAFTHATLGRSILTAFSQSIPFDAARRMAEFTQSTNLTFTVNTTGALDESECKVSIIADNVHTVTFHATFNQSPPADGQDFDTTLGRVNMISFWREEGRYYYGITLGPVV